MGKWIIYSNIARFTSVLAEIDGFHLRSDCACRREVIFAQLLTAIACAAIGFINPTIVNASESTSTNMVGADVNEIMQIRSVDSDVRYDSHVEIKVTSYKLFSIRAMPPVLRIGGQRFRKSRSPKDGNLNTLIFILTAEEYAKTESGDPVSVILGQDDSPVGRWFFGHLTK